MAVQYVNGKGGGFLGGLGGLFSLAGTLLPGAPAWMSPLGTGLTAANSAMQGDIGGTATGLAGLIKQMNDAGGFENMFGKKPAPYQRDPYKYSDRYNEKL